MAGEAFGRKSSVSVHSPLYFIEIKNTLSQKVSIGDNLHGESALYILDGSISNEGNIYEPKQILIARDSKLCEFEMAPNTTVYIFGGEPFSEERFLDWNFVSSRKDRLKQAKEEWINQRFPKINGETEFVPYPTFKR